MSNVVDITKARASKALKARDKKPTTARAALDKLRRLTKKAPLPVASYSGLAAKFSGWDRKRAWEAVGKWEDDGLVVTVKDGKELVSIQAFPDQSRGAGVETSKPARPKKPTRKTAKAVRKTDASGVRISPSPGVRIPDASDVGNSALPRVGNSNVPHPENIEGARVGTIQNTLSQSNTYDEHLGPHFPTETALPIPPANAEISDAGDTKNPTPEMPSATPSDTPDLRGNFMGFFGRKPRTEPPAEQASEQVDEAGEGGAPASPYSGYSSPTVHYRTMPPQYAERLNWRMQPHQEEESLPAPAKASPPPVESKPPPKPRYKRSWMLTLLAFGFYALSVSINIWNAKSGGDDWGVLAMAAGGVLAEGVMFFMPAWAITLKHGARVGAFLILAFLWAFALTNSLRMASIIGADQTMVRSDRVTTGMTSSTHELDIARDGRNRACRKGQEKSQACAEAKKDVARQEAVQDRASGAVASAAKPENRDFADLLSWVTHGLITPGERDFAMLWLLFRTVLPQLGGLILMIARRREA